MSYIFISILFGIFIGLALSVDAFMLSLVYGVTIRSRKEALMTSIFVGIFHFVMPLIGYFLALLLLGNFFNLPFFHNQIENFGILILIFLGMLMIFKKNEHSTLSIKNIISKLLFAFSVSLDSFFIGIALTTSTHLSIGLITVIFFLVSGTLTFIALRIVNRTKKYIHFIKDLNVIAGLILIIFAFITLIL